MLKIPCRHFVWSNFIHADIFSEFVVVVILSEWWLVLTTANQCGHIPDSVLRIVDRIVRAFSYKLKIVYMHFYYENVKTNYFWI